MPTREEVKAWKDERDRKYADGSWIIEHRAEWRKIHDKAAREDFGKYTWDAVFERMTLDELLVLQHQWWKAIQRLSDHEVGHELLVMRWNQGRLNRAILIRQGANLIGES